MHGPVPRSANYTIPTFCTPHEHDIRVRASNREVFPEQSWLTSPPASLIYHAAQWLARLIVPRGLAPRKVRAQQTELSKADRKQLLEKGATADPEGVETERVSGRS